MMQNYLIRKATVNDAQALATIGATTFYDTFRPYNEEKDMLAYIKKSYQTNTVKGYLNNPHIHYYVCIANNIMIGYIKLIHHAAQAKLKGNTIELEKIYVLKEYFGTDAGKLLMQQAIEHSKQFNFNILFLGVWKENIRAVKFYEKNGFSIFDNRFFELGNRVCEDYMMKKEL
jgi:diamine N-acetyltransferase